jgi:hypothetical protein
MIGYRGREERETREKREERPTGKKVDVVFFIKHPRGGGA